MYFENEDNLYLKSSEQDQFRRAYQMHNGLLYHYATGETLWKILESDCFLARHIRFSNDSEEYKTGQSTIQKFIESYPDLSESEKKEICRRIEENPMMYYMICFCKSGDLLSQWRGYAKDGVSIGLDFTGGITGQEDLRRHVEYFAVLNNSEQQKMLKKDEAENKYYIDGESLTFLQMPYRVQYVDKRGKVLRKPIKDVLGEIWGSGMAEEGITRLLQYIPFIKDKGFEEEAEFRLIYDMEFLGQSKAHSSKIRSKKIDYLDTDNIKKPYIRVEFGRAEEKLAEVKAVHFGTDAAEIMAIHQFCSDNKWNIELEKDDNRQGIYVGEGCNQEEVLEWIEKYIEAWRVPQKQKDAIKIWCEGHLPIRKVIIGPSEKQTDMKESLEHYKSTVYWLRYIDVEISKIPLRS